MEKSNLDVAFELVSRKKNPVVFMLKKVLI